LSTSTFQNDPPRHFHPLALQQNARHRHNLPDGEDPRRRVR
jgi:hypothetical protein